MNKHTPGPWHWDSDPIKDDPLKRVRYRVTTKGKTITQCYYSNSDPCAEWDARLIAAAPDMLEALKNLTNRLAPQIFGIDFNPKELIEARAAIAKAEGREMP